MYQDGRHDPRHYRWDPIFSENRSRTRLASLRQSQVDFKETVRLQLELEACIANANDWGLNAIPAYLSAELRRFYNLDGVGLPEIEDPSRWPEEKRAWFDERKAEGDGCQQLSADEKVEGLLSASGFFEVLKLRVRHTSDATQTRWKLKNV